MSFVVGSFRVYPTRTMHLELDSRDRCPISKFSRCGSSVARKQRIFGSEDQGAKMQVYHTPRSNELRLRLVFRNGAVSSGLSAGATLADICDLVERIAALKHSIPLAVDIKIAGETDVFSASKGASHATH
jgi:hypothetical protein